MSNNNTPGGGFLGGLGGNSSGSSNNQSNGSNHSNNAKSNANDNVGRIPRSHRPKQNQPPHRTKGANNRADDKNRKFDPQSRPDNHFQAKQAKGQDGLKDPFGGPDNHWQDKQAKSKEGLQDPFKGSNNHWEDQANKQKKPHRSSSRNKTPNSPSGDKDKDKNKDDKSKLDDDAMNRSGDDSDSSKDKGKDKDNGDDAANPSQKKAKEEEDDKKKKDSGDNDGKTGDPSNAINKVPAQGGFSPLKSLNAAKNMKDDIQHPIKHMGDQAKLQAGKMALKGGAGLLGGWLAGQKIGQTVGNLGNAANAIGSHIGSALGSIGHTLGNAAGAVGSGVKGAIGAVGGAVSHAAGAVGMGASAASAVGTSVGLTTVIGAPIAGIATGVGLIIPAIAPKSVTDALCQNVEKVEQTQTYSADFQIKGIKFGGAQSDVVIGIEKWCAKNQLNAAQTAGILANAYGESSLNKSTNDGNYLGISINNVGSSGFGKYTPFEYMDVFEKEVSTGATDGPFWKKYKSNKSMSPHDAGYSYAKNIVRPTIPGKPQYTIDKSNERGNWAEQIYKLITGGKGSSATITSAVTNTATSAIDSAANCKSNVKGTASDSTNTADGTGSISENPGDSYLMWNEGHVPADVKKYIVDPKSVGMAYGNRKGWSNEDSDGQCVPFAASFYWASWTGFKGSVPRAIGGKDTVGTVHSGSGGTISHTPKAGALVSAQPDVTPLTGGSGYGHTFVVEHVLQNGDFIIAQQNFPAISSNGFKGSGSYTHTPYSWNYGIISHKFLQKYEKSLTFLVPSSSHHLKWNKK